VTNARHKSWDDIGHYAVGTADMIATSSLDRKFAPDLWKGAAQKPMLYFSVGGQVEDHDTGRGHRRSLAELDAEDYSNYVKR
jgi:hypothetical protein